MRLSVPDGGADGVLLSLSGQTGGWSLYVKEGKPKYVYNWLAREKYVIVSPERCRPVTCTCGLTSLTTDAD